ncbi:MAG: GNAT family N-acetyltransferase [Desulfobacterales bacterium]|nr:GNAT family N-acetyltransferase [Desulfobacterales bacterium]
MVQGKIEISTDKNLLNLDFIHTYLTHSYWAKGITRGAVKKSIRHSFCFGIYEEDQQAGFARVITDFTTFAYLADVFIDPSFQGRGLGKQLVGHIMAHKDLKQLRRWHLLTDDAHGLYNRFGFNKPSNPILHMEKTSKPQY